MQTINLLTKILPYLAKIKQKIDITENEFFEQRFENTDKAFEFWIYSIVDDLYKSWMKIIRENEIIESEDNKYLEKKEDNLNWLNFERYLYEGISIELDLWIRKLIEHFLNLTLLKNTTKVKDLENVSKIYFISLRIKDTLTNHSTYKEYYDFEHESSMIEKQFLVEKINSLIIEKQKPFFLVDKYDFNKLNKIFKSTAKLYKESLKYCCENEKITLWLCYKMYHNLTQWIHWNWHFREENIKLESCVNKYNHLILIISNIIYSIYDLLEIEKDDFLIKSVLLDDNLKANFTQKYNKWDLVLFLWDLYQIKKCNKKSDYGYFSYLIYRESWIWNNEQHVPQELLKLALNEDNFEKVFNQIEYTFKKEDLEMLNNMSKNEKLEAFKKVIMILNKNWINVFKN